MDSWKTKITSVATLDEANLEKKSRLDFMQQLSPIGVSMSQSTVTNNNNLKYNLESVHSNVRQTKNQIHIPLWN